MNNILICTSFIIKFSNISFYLLGIFYLNKLYKNNLVSNTSYNKIIGIMKCIIV